MIQSHKERLVQPIDAHRDLAFTILRLRHVSSRELYANSLHGMSLDAYELAIGKLEAGGLIRREGDILIFNGSTPTIVTPAESVFADTTVLETITHGG